LVAARCEHVLFTSAMTQDKPVGPACAKCSLIELGDVFRAQDKE
jgi:hypothetical protein